MSEPTREPNASYGLVPTGFRLPADTRLGAVHLQVADLERSVLYYQRIIGLQVLGRSLDHVELGAPGAGPFIRIYEKRGVHPAPRRGAFGLFHFAVLLPDRAALGQFVRHLSQYPVQAGMADHLVSEAIYLTDPDGLGIEIYADRPRATWSHAGRELRMTTEPLDVDDLLEHGAGQRWGGVPAGTRIGHVHLHVGRLDTASAFYHEALGFDTTVWSFPGALFFAAGGYHHHLGVNTWSPGPSATDDQARLLEWELRVDAGQVPEALANLARHGHTASEGPSGWRVADPWGTSLRLIATNDVRSAE